MRKLWLFVAALLPLAGVAAAPPSSDRVHILPSTSAYPESIGANPRTGIFYTGSLIDGTLFRGSLDSSKSSVFLPAGSDGRTNVAGVKVDGEGRIWIADAFNGRVLVYNDAGQLLHDFHLLGPGFPTVNDLVFSHGWAYVTDSSRPFLYRLSESDADSAGVTLSEPWLAVSPFVHYMTGEGPFGVNLNGIVASPDGETLWTVQTNTGLLFKVDVDTGAISKVDTGGVSLLFGDGLLRVDRELYVARNAANLVLKMEISADWNSARLIATMTNPQFVFPTALIAMRNRLLITNAQLNVVGNPQLPFTVLDFPLHPSADR